MRHSHVLPLKCAAALRDRMEVDLYRNANQIPTNSGNESDPRVPQKPSFRLWGPRTLYTFCSKTSWVTIKTLLCLELQQI